MREERRREEYKGKEYVVLTEEITGAWSGMSTKEYKNCKGLKKENLWDNMSTTEIVLNVVVLEMIETVANIEEKK